MRDLERELGDLDKEVERLDAAGEDCNHIMTHKVAPKLLEYSMLRLLVRGELANKNLDNLVLQYRVPEEKLSWIQYLRRRLNV